mgnify:CR=1 FL=1
MTWPAVRLLSIRVLGAVAVLLALSVLIFALLYLAPGDVVKNLLGNRPSSPEAVNAIRAQYHLDESAVQQYLRWLGGFLHGDLGESVRLQVPVSEAISQRVGLTALLCAMALVLSVLVAVPLGVLSAVRAGGWIDRSASGLAVIGLSAPTFAIGLLLLLVFAYVIPVLPVYGVGDGGLDTIRHLTLPAISLALGLGAIVVKLTRAAMLRELDTDYVTAARARGLSEATVLRIALRNAAIPITTGAGLLLTFGLALIFEGTLINLFGVSGARYATPEILQGGLNLGFMFLPTYRAWVLVAALAMCLFTWFMIERTRLGAYLRAGTENSQLMQAFGVNVPLLITLTYGFGVGLAAFAGVLAAPLYPVSPTMGSSLLIVVFAVVVIGGMGSILGAILTGLGMGIIEGLTKVYYPEASNTVIFLVMILVLMLRPAGLFGKEA